MKQMHLVPDLGQRFTQMRNFGDREINHIKMTKNIAVTSKAIVFIAIVLKWSI
jgi:hypothetical protein